MNRRRTFRDVERDAIVAEREGVLTLACSYGLQLDAMIAAGKIKGEDATELKQRVRAFADMIATGLHRDGADPAGVRDAMRAIVKGESL